MRLLTLIFAMVSCAALSGCVVHDRHGRHGVHGAKVVVPVPVVVETSGKGCPPGQAKKGKC